ncbi:Type IV fimbrial assembly, ATPase PilB [hydrothermal vent metagenome]|uniref:Type IV fimbrial assembly, ATPase PilB n=1 Tax=hydrothermal vent metagenome TaxID=652676 RepID=A0A3B1CAW9_9ZZZZ
MTQTFIKNSAIGVCGVRAKKRLGDILVQSGAVSAEGLGAALLEHRRTGNRLGATLISLGLMSEEDMITVLSSQTGAPMVDLSKANPEPELLRLVPEFVARKYVLFPLERSSEAIHVAMADPLDLLATDELAIRLSHEVEVAIATKDQILDAIDRFYGMQGQPKSHSEFQVFEKKFVYRAGEKSETPIARLVETIIREAVISRASDIHIEPVEKRLRIRYRIDGIMFTAPAPPEELEQAIASRVKIISNMDIAESRIPQDGRFKLTLNKREIEFRVSTFPTIYGESVVIRILNRGDNPLGLDKIGLMGKTLEDFRKALIVKSGMIIATGPTGAGKTTTLYSAVDLLSSPEKTIVTIEDPVEYSLEFVRQTQINPKAGLTFASGLRSILRQDPDVIMLGEIRDCETATIAAQAAMTGHLVITTMHTTGAAEAVTRLMDLGIEPYQISSILLGTTAQRLVRTVCSKCSWKKQAEAKRGAPGHGCAHCNQSGYRGRTGIFEFLAIDDEIRKLIMNKTPAQSIHSYAIQNRKMISMREDGLAKVKEGVTTFKEIERAQLG